MGRLGASRIYVNVFVAVGMTAAGYTQTAHDSEDRVTVHIYGQTRRSTNPSTMTHIELVRHDFVVMPVA
jgi:hypothetical protein